jgi:hypothetical protein
VPPKPKTPRDALLKPLSNSHFSALQSHSLHSRNLNFYWSKIVHLFLLFSKSLIPLCRPLLRTLNFSPLSFQITPHLCTPDVPVFSYFHDSLQSSPRKYIFLYTLVYSVIYFILRGRGPENVKLMRVLQWQASAHHHQAMYIPHSTVELGKKRLEYPCSTLQRSSFPN